MRVTRLAVAAALAALLAAGCAGEPAGGQIEVQGVTSTAADTAAATEPAGTQRSATTQRTATTQPAPTTRRTAPIGQPAVNPVLTVMVVDYAAGGMVVTPPGETCTEECPYRFPKGQRIELRPVNTNTMDFRYEVSGGQSQCEDGFSCEVTLLMNTTVTVIPK
jgi:hypothetical protein